jgi:hypothetical protein
LPTKSQLQAESLSTAFLTPLALTSFLAEVKWSFINFFTTHHNLGSSRATPSCLGDFTSKNNKCHKDCFTKLNCSSAHKEDLTSTQTWIYHKSLKPYKEVLGRAHKGFRMSIFISGINSLQRREGEAFIHSLKN